MRFLLFVGGDESLELSPEDLDRLRQGGMAWAEEMDERGVRVDGSVLAATGEARTVRVRDGQVRTSDGPFAQTSEQINGFDILECGDLDEALAIAAKHPVAAIGFVEVRALRDI
jgi:hypothetical protein